MRRVPRRVAPRVNIRRELEILSETHPTIPFEQFLQLCRDNDLPELEARSMAKDLTASGVAAHFPDHGEPWADTLFLRPAEILRAFDAAVGVGPKHNAVQADISRVRARHAAVECVATASARQLAAGSSGALHLKIAAVACRQRLAPLNADVVRWRSEASRAANRRLLLGLGGYFGVQATFLLYTFELIDGDHWPTVEEILEPGWDVMEPLTYTVGSGFAWLSFGWFAFSRHQLGYQALRARYVERTTQALQRKHGFPAARHEELTDELGVYQRWLANHELHEAEEWQEKEVRKSPRLFSIDEF